MRQRPIHWFLAVTWLFAGTLLSGPSHSAVLTEWDPITDAELKQTQSLVEPGADAEVIFRHEWVEDHFSSSGIGQTRDVYVRIKLLTAAGAQSYGTVSIDFPRRGSHVGGIQARTILPDGTIVPLGKKAVIEEQLVKKGREGILRKNFALPSVQPGCLIEYRYRLELSDASLASQSYHVQGLIPIQLIAFHVKPVDAPGWYVRTQKFHTNATSPPGRVDGYYDFVARDQRSYVEEPDSPPEYQLRGWMMMFYTQEELESPEVYWPRLGKRLAQDFDATTRPDAQVSRLAKELTAAATDDQSKIAALIGWIRTNFRVVRSSSADSLRAAGLRDVDNGRSALAQRGGTHLDANLTFATLARAAGLEVRLLRVPSREDYFFERKVMMDEQFIPFVQVAVRCAGTWRFFDVGQRYLPADMMPWMQESQLALFCDRDSSHFVETGVASPEQSEFARVADLVLDESGTAEGEVRLRMSGHFNSYWRDLFASVTSADTDSTFRRTTQSEAGVEYSKVELLNGSDPREPLEIRLHLRLEVHATVTGKRLLFEPSVFHAKVPSRFTSNTRKNPVYFEYAWSEIDTVRLRLPAGWVPETMDSPEPIRVPGVADYESELAVRADGTALEFTRRLGIGRGGNLFFGVKEYSEIKKLFDLIRDRDRTSVTLIRAGTQP